MAEVFVNAFTRTGFFESVFEEVHEILELKNHRALVL